MSERINKKKREEKRGEGNGKGIKPKTAEKGGFRGFSSSKLFKIVFVI